MAGYSQAVPDWRLMQRTGEASQGDQAYADLEKQRQIRSAALQQAATTAPRTTLGVSLTPLAKNASSQTSLAQANAGDPQASSAKKPNPAAQIGQSAATSAATELGSSMLTPMASSAAPAAAAPTVSTTGGGMMLPGMGGATTTTTYGTSAAAAPTGISASGALANLASMGVLPAAGIAAGTYLLGNGAYDMAQGTPTAYSDADKDPVGAGSRAQLAYSTMGLSELGRALGLWGNKKTPSHLREVQAFQNLRDQGVYIPDSVLAQAANNKRRSTEDLIVAKDSKGNVPLDFRGYDRDRNWVNNKFAQSRNVNDLRAQDIVGYAAFAQKDKDWFRRPLEQQLDIARKALEAGAITEGHGQIGIDDSKWKMPELPPVEQPAAEPKKENK